MFDNLYYNIIYYNTLRVKVFLNNGKLIGHVDPERRVGREPCEYTQQRVQLKVGSTGVRDMDLYQKLLAEQRNAEEQGLGHPVPSARELALLRRYAQRGVHNKGDAVTRAKLMCRFPLVDAMVKAEIEDRGDTLSMNR